MSVKTCVFAGAITILAVTRFVGPAAAQQSQAWDRCSGEGEIISRDLRINACTTVIQSGKESTKNLATAYFIRGQAYGYNGQYDRAIPDFDQAIELDLSNAEVFYSRGNAYRNKGQYDRAIQDLDQAIVLDPKNADVFIARGMAYNAKGQIDRAIQDYDQAIVLDPNDAGGFYNRGITLNAKGQYDRAILDFDHAIKLDPYDQQSKKYRAEAIAKKNSR